MKKSNIRKILLLALCVVFAVSLCGCGGDDSKGDKDADKADEGNTYADMDTFVVPYEAYNLEDYLDLGEYKGLEMFGYTIEITDEQIENEIKRDLSDAGKETGLKDGQDVRDGDTVNIAFDGKIDGKSFEGGSTDAYEFELGSGTFIEGFQEQIVGHKVGETFDIDVTFPDNYSKTELAGKDAVFTITINSAKAKEVPEIADYVKNNTDFATVDEYKESVRERLYGYEEQSQIEKQESNLWNKVMDSTEVKQYPEKELKEYEQYNSEKLDRKAEENGMSREDMLATYNFGSEDEFNNANEDSSKVHLKQEMIMMLIAQKEGIECSQEEIDEKIDMYINDLGYTPDRLQNVTVWPVRTYMYTEIIHSKVEDLMRAEAVVR